MPDEIRTERLLLRRARWDDLEPLFEIFSDPEAMRYWSTPPHKDIGQTSDWLRSMIEADPETSDDFIIECEGRCVGKLGSWKLGEIGFLLASAHWGKGMASEAMGAFLHHRGMIAPGSTIIADVDPRNEASIRLLERHGFAETGRANDTWEINGEMCDSVYLERRL